MDRKRLWTKSVRGLIAGALLTGLLSCGSRGGGGNDDEPPTDQAHLLQGAWMGTCQEAPGKTYRRAAYEFDRAAGTVTVKLTTFQGPDCTPPAVLTYRFRGTYWLSDSIANPRPLRGDVTAAYLTLHHPDYLKAANRPPGLYQHTEWKLDEEVDLRERVVPTNYLTGVSESLFPVGTGFQIDGDRLFLGREVNTRSPEYFTRADGTSVAPT